MSTTVDEVQMFNPGLLGTWVAQRFGIWQLHFLSDQKLGSLASNLGLMSLSLGNHVKHMWQLGLLKADLVVSHQPLELVGLIKVNQDNEGKYYYADERLPIQQEDGLGGAISELKQLPLDIELYFHPFRYYVLYHIDRVIRPNIHPMQIFQPVDRYPNLLGRIIADFQRWSSSDNFRQSICRWNNITSLSVAAEPCTYEKIFGVFRYSPFIGEEEQRESIRQHWNDFRGVLKNIDIERIEKMRDDLCTNAELLDPNKNIHTILRLTKGEARLRKMKGRLGGAMYLLTMAEILRRSAEEAFEVELSEEDELGFGMTISGVKEQLYGANRLIDDNDARSEFLRQFGLDYGVRVRWYVEGYTEYAALDSILGRFAAIDLINLRGNVVAKMGKGVAFRDSLKSDLRSRIFSFISFDGDRGDYLRAVRRAAEEDDICGMFFISTPDFEFENFTVEELVQIVWELALDNGANPEEHFTLIEATAGAKSGEEFFKSAKRAVSVLSQVDKGSIWGERLMIFAWNNPHMSLSDNTTRSRPIVEAVISAIRTVRADYNYTRTQYRVDPTTGQSVKRDTSLQIPD